MQWTKGKLTTVLDWNVPSLYRRDETEDGDKIKHCLQFFLLENMAYDLNKTSPGRVRVVKKVWVLVND